VLEEKESKRKEEAVWSAVAHVGKTVEFAIEIAYSSRVAYVDHRAYGSSTVRRYRFY